MEIITQKLLKKLFYYDGENLIWQKKGVGISRGKIAGHLQPEGYINIKIQYKKYKAHRLVYIYHHGGDYHNEYEIDHINGNKADNRIENLRLVTHQENHWNRAKAKGYYFDKRTQRYGASIGLNGKSKFLGFFINKKDAHKAYLEAKAKLHIIKNRNVPL